MRRRHFIMLIGIVAVLAVIGAAVEGGLYYLYPVQMTTIAGMVRNYLISWSAPPGTTTTELNAAYKAASAALTRDGEEPAELWGGVVALTSAGPEALVSPVLRRGLELPWASRSSASAGYTKRAATRERRTRE